MAGPVALVGRERELSDLLGGLSRGARVVLLTGDAGVGKTRFVEEAMARAATAGLVMVRGECLPVSGTLPLLPVAAALGKLGRLEGGGLLAAGLTAAPRFVRAEVERLLPLRRHDRRSNNSQTAFMPGWAKAHNIPSSHLW
jgi:predicted ATPase